MSTSIIPIPYQIGYIVIPTISIIGNCFIVYVTIRSKSLRSPCAILIGLISSGDIMHMFAHYVMIISYNIVTKEKVTYAGPHSRMEDHLMREDYCVYWQLFPIFGQIFSCTLLSNIAFDRLIATRMF
ncbi:hypothetical protein GCK32_019700 [Trichostrongylus colubriformis]|uniref:G-protein coupled receptors family 1 profile domain-containing protein n=1 Tax=Trichostrongylus colubriformis TaxID=6319 RepID=A0AAN8FB94_TRICO